MEHTFDVELLHVYPKQRVKLSEWKHRWKVKPSESKNRWCLTRLLTWWGVSHRKTCVKKIQTIVNSNNSDDNKNSHIVTHWCFNRNYKSTWLKRCVRMKRCEQINWCWSAHQPTALPPRAQLRQTLVSASKETREGETHRKGGNVQCSSALKETISLGDQRDAILVYLPPSVSELESL